MKDLGIYNDLPKEKERTDFLPGKKLTGGNCRSGKRISIFRVLIISMACCSMYFLGYSNGFEKAMDSPQPSGKAVVRDSPAVQFAMLVLLNLEKGIVVRDGCVYEGDRHLDDCPCTVKGSAEGGNRHTLLLRAYKYFEDHPDQDWIVNNAIYQYNKTGSWKYRAEPSLRPLTPAMSAEGSVNSVKQ